MAKLDDVAKDTPDNEGNKRDRTKGDVMNKDFSNTQPAVNVQLDATAPEVSSITTIVQTIVCEATDYAKKSLDASRVFVENLVSAKSLHTVIEIQTEYAKTSCAAFLAQATKMGELYSNLAKANFKPIGQTIADVQSTK